MGFRTTEDAEGEMPERRDPRQEREDFVLYELLCLRCDRDPKAEPEALRRARERLRRDLFAKVPR